MKSPLQLERKKIREDIRKAEESYRLKIARIEADKFWSPKSKKVKIDYNKMMLGKRLRLLRGKLDSTEAKCYYCGKRLGRFWGTACRKHEKKLEGLDEER